MTCTSDDAERLIAALSDHMGLVGHPESSTKQSRLVVAFSGGVDSSVVAAAACRANLDSVTALTARSPSVPQWQLDEACRVAAELGIDHEIITTREMDREDYRRNDRHRCFYCKDTLYETLSQWADDNPTVTIASGTNADDLGDYRPGIVAGNRRGVITPLADLGFTKQRVRELAVYFGLSNHDLPASPCLASRVAYGVEVTPARLRQIETAESYLRELGFKQVRVRLLTSESASIEVDKAAVADLHDLNLDGSITQTILSMGFNSVSIDDRGFRSGRLNEGLASPKLVQLEAAASSSATMQHSKEAPR